MGSQYKSKEELERRYLELCEEGDFGDELLEVMEQIEHWDENQHTNQQENTSYIEDSASQQEELEVVIQHIIRDFRIRLNEYTEDVLNLSILHDATTRKGLSGEEFKYIVNEIIRQAKDRYDCYIMPKESIYRNKQTQDVWEWLDGDSILFSRNPLYMDIQKCQVDLSKYCLHSMGIGYVNYLALWADLGCKFVMSA